LIEQIVMPFRPGGWQSAI